MENITVREVFNALDQLKEEVKSISKRNIYSDVSSIRFEVSSVKGICDSLRNNLERVENKINSLLLGKETFTNKNEIEKEYPEETIKSKNYFDREFRMKHELLEKRISDLERVVYAKEYSDLNKNYK